MNSLSSVQPGGLDFAALPLVEVTLRVAPSELVPSDLGSVIRLSSSLKRAGYSEPEYLRAPLPGIGTASLITPHIHPGVRLVNPEERIELIYQSNLLAASWKNESLHPDIRYVRYDALREATSCLLHKVPATEKGVKAKFHAINLTYVNFIRTQEAPTVQDAAQFLAPGLVPDQVQRDCLFNETNLCWRERGGTDLRLQLRRLVTTGTEQSVHGLVLTTVAGRIFPPGHQPLPEADRCHALLVEWFAEMISDHAKESWGIRYG